MRELNLNEVQAVSGGAGMTADAMLGLGFAGLTVTIPVIVGGAIFGIPTLGLGFIAMTVGIVGAAISGGMAIMGVVASAVNRGRVDPVTPEV
ncbi:hypothetical protein [Mixta theicola]|uniref:hypothetical protein n=1 Tax=Mixta theicola TaxID=1458355 RepID=UPI00198119A2|nr:hypothetical protein [Mixta theicola]GLR08609.1 hypothetical protein GCM10007905_13280 [Mixta theicola]